MKWKWNWTSDWKRKVVTNAENMSKIIAYIFIIYYGFNYCSFYSYYLSEDDLLFSYFLFRICLLSVIIMLYKSFICFCYEFKWNNRTILKFMFSIFAFLFFKFPSYFYFVQISLKFVTCSFFADLSAQATTIVDQFQ